MVINWLQKDEPDFPPEPPRVRAAEYVHMSTEHQKYSTDNQGEANRFEGAMSVWVLVRG